MPRFDAVATSIVLYPAPARTTSDSAPASSIGAVTAVLRTTSTSALLSRTAAVNASSLRSGSYRTSQPAAFRPSRPLFSNLSATSTRIDDSNNVYQKTVAELRFEPRRLGRHDLARVGHRHQIGHADRIEREGHRRLS